VKINFATVETIDESVSSIAKQSYHKSAYCLLGMTLYLSALPFCQFLELPLRGIKGLPHNRRQALVQIAFARVANCHQLVIPRYRNIKSHPKRTPALLVRLWFLDGNATTD
jgi:hypothetical protein